jgi:hypothetical protein
MCATGSLWDGAFIRRDGEVVHLDDEPMARFSRKRPFDIAGIHIAALAARTPSKAC